MSDGHLYQQVSVDVCSSLFFHSIFKEYNTLDKDIYYDIPLVLPPEIKLAHLQKRNHNFGYYKTILNNCSNCELLLILDAHFDWQ